MKRVELRAEQFKIDENLLNSGLHCYTADIEFKKDEIKLYVFLKDTERDKFENHIEKVTDQINWVLDNMDYIEHEIKNSHLIDLKNDNWLEEGEKQIKPKQFMKRIALASIAIDIKDNEITGTDLDYDDGDIFWGHSINIQIKDRKVCNIEI